MKAIPSLAVLFALGGCAQPEAAAAKAAVCAASEGGALEIESAWVRAQEDAGATSAAYFTACNAGMAPVTIQGLSTPAAAVVELHETTRDASGVVSMAPMGPITLAPGERIAFEPGGKHAMLMGLSAPIVEGAAATLTLELAGGATVSAEAKAVSAVEAAGRAH